MELTLSALREAITASHPELRDARFSLLTEGWDSVAVDVDDQLIFKFPRHQKAARALAVEARLLAVVRPRVVMPLPDLELHEGPPLFTRHAKLPGEHLVSVQYAQLSPSRRQQLGEAMALFYTQLHGLPMAVVQAAGAKPLGAWLTPDEMLRQAWPLLPEDLRSYAEDRISQWRALPPDPYGTVFGYFDGHGWNMAFDHDAGRLHGLYDFGDAGVGDLHREFIYSNWISRDLTDRIIDGYERISGKVIDRHRVELLSGVLRIWEVATCADRPRQVEAMVRTLADWAAG